MKKGLTIFLSSIILMLYPLSAFAIGENDPLWNGNGHPSYQKKVMKVGNQILIANDIHERIAFLIQYDYINHTINATADQYGTVSVYYDLLKYIESDDELAAVLSHEISHEILHHNRNDAYRRLGIKMILYPAIIANIIFAPFVPVYLLKNKINKSINASFTLQQEYAADAKGVDLMVKAGYNPLAMESIMGKIAGDGDLAQIWRDHPVGSNRIGAIHQIIVTKYPQFLETPTTEEKPADDKTIKPDSNIKPVNNTENKQ